MEKTWGLSADGAGEQVQRRGGRSRVSANTVFRCGRAVGDMMLECLSSAYGIEKVKVYANKAVLSKW